MTIPDVAIGPFGWTCIVVGAWLIVGCVVAVPLGRAIRRADRDVEPVDPYVDREGTRFLEFYPPPVPASRRDTDDWMALVPVECLSDDEIGLVCADIEAREGWAA